MTKRDNELTRPELLDKRVKHLLDKWEMHRGQLPQDLITALEGVRKAHDMPYVRSGLRDAVVGVDMPVPWSDDAPPPAPVGYHWELLPGPAPTPPLNPANDPVSKEPVTAGTHEETPANLET